MEEKPPSFTVTDRRKFTLEGDPRDEAETPAEQESAAEHAETTARVINFPKPEEPEPAEATPLEEELAGPSAQESAEQHAAYEQSTREIDSMLRQANPGAAEVAQDTTFEHVIQSIYLSAIMAMGAGAEQGKQPRIDIVGARQSIDMLAILQEKTKGNLNEKEQRLLQNALFDLRMMFIEITNAIAISAQQPPPKKK